MHIFHLKTNRFQSELMRCCEMALIMALCLSESVTCVRRWAGDK